MYLICNNNILHYRLLEPKPKIPEKKRLKNCLAGIDAVCQKAEEMEAMICRVVHWYLFDRSAQAYKR